MSSSSFPDHFSQVSKDYAKHRLSYPATLFETVVQFAQEGVPPERRTGVCVDQATGSGQAARSLSRFFEKVIACDASQDQLDHAPRDIPHIEFRRCKAEQTNLADASVDLVTAAAGLHWFDIPQFLVECERILVPGGAMACWTYGSQISIDGAQQVSEVVARLWQGRCMDFMAPQLRFVANLYEDIDVAPLVDRRYQRIDMRHEMSLEAFIAFVSTWSVVSTMRKAGADPIPQFQEELLAAAGAADLSARFSFTFGVGLLMARRQRS